MHFLEWNYMKFDYHFNWNLFLRVKLTLFSTESDYGLAFTMRQAIIRNNDGKFTDVYMRSSATMS